MEGGRRGAHSTAHSTLHTALSMHSTQHTARSAVRYLGIVATGGAGRGRAGWGEGVGRRGSETGKSEEVRR